MPHTAHDVRLSRYLGFKRQRFDWSSFYSSNRTGGKLSGANGEPSSETSGANPLVLIQQFIGVIKDVLKPFQQPTGLKAISISHTSKRRLRCYFNPQVRIETSKKRAILLHRCYTHFTRICLGYRRCGRAGSLRH